MMLQNILLTVKISGQLHVEIKSLGPKNEELIKFSAKSFCFNQNACFVCGFLNKKK